MPQVNSRSSSGTIVMSEGLVDSASKSELMDGSWHSVAEVPVPSLISPYMYEPEDESVYL